MCTIAMATSSHYRAQVHAKSPNMLPGHAAWCGAEVLGQTPCCNAHASVGIPRSIHQGSSCMPSHHGCESSKAMEARIPNAVLQTVAIICLFQVQPLNKPAQQAKLGSGLQPSKPYMMHTPLGTYQIKRDSRGEMRAANGPSKVLHNCQTNPLLPRGRLPPAIHAQTLWPALSMIPKRRQDRQIAPRSCWQGRATARRPVSSPGKVMDMCFLMRHFTGTPLALAT